MLGKKNKKASDDDEDDADDEEGKKKPKKKGLNPIQLVIVGGLVVFIFYDDIFGPGEETPPAETASSFKRPKREKPKPVETTEAKPEDSTAAPATGTDTPTSEAKTDTSVTTETSPDSSVQVTSTDTTPEDTSIDTPVETAPDTTSDTSTIDTSSDTPIDTATTEPTEPTENEPVSTAPVNNDVIDDTVSDNGDNLTDQILQDLEKQAKSNQPKTPLVKPGEYIAPPDYDYTGRGLVYNCTGKHWACVDGPSYKICEQNSASTQNLKKKTECHPFNVYATPKGCQATQNRMVSSSAKTDFCN